MLHRPDSSYSSSFDFRWNYLLSRASGPRESAFSLLLGSLAHDRRLRSDSYNSQRPGVRECGGCEGRSTTPLHSRSVRGFELNCRSSAQIFASPTNLQHCRTKSHYKSTTTRRRETTHRIKNLTARLREHFKTGAMRPSSEFPTPVRFAFPDTSERRSPGVGY